MQNQSPSALHAMVLSQSVEEERPISPLVGCDTLAPFSPRVKELTAWKGKLSLPGFSALLDSLNQPSFITM